MILLQKSCQHMNMFLENSNKSMSILFKLKKKYFSAEYICPIFFGNILLEFYNY